MSNLSTEELIAEVTEEMLKDTSSEEVRAEKQRIEDEKQRIEQARWVVTSSQSLLFLNF